MIRRTKNINTSSKVAGEANSQIITIAKDTVKDLPIKIIRIKKSSPLRYEIRIFSLKNSKYIHAYFLVIK